MRTWPLTILAALIAIMGASCAQEGSSTQPLAKGRAQLWSENCMKCHNARSSKYYNDEQWDVAMMHMRIRGNLTADETKSITEFLQSAN